MLRLPRALAVIAVLAGPNLSGHARAEDATYAVGRQGWSLELFGAEVSLLRSNAAAGQPADEAVLILSCDGRERRLQLSFPARNEPPGLSTASGYALVRAVDRAGVAVLSVSAPFTVFGRATMVVTNRGKRDAQDPVLRVARMLLAQPAGLDLLLRPLSGSVALGQSSPLRLSLAFGPSDGVAFGNFVDACSRAEETYKG